MKLTIFTPAYNRANLLYRLYESLQRQTVTCFEWIIVDDASTDDTQKVVEERIINNTKFETYYYCQQHGGKHRAINYALEKAKGEYFFIVDSDDYITDNAVELILKWIDDVEGIANIAGVAGLKVSEDGRIWGISKDKDVSQMMGTVVDATNFERKKFNLLGDKAEVYKTDILRKHKFPEFENEFFVTEAVCWDAIAADGYKLRWYFEPIYVADYLEDGLTKNGANELRGRINNYKGYCYYICQSLKIVPLKERMVRFRAYNKTRKAMEKGIVEAAQDLNVSTLKYLYYLLVLMPFVYVLRMIDKILLK